jgi:hypothetical protein
MTVAIAVDQQTTPPIAPEQSGAELRAELAELLERDLLRRFTNASPRERTVIETVATIAANLAQLTKSFGPDCDERIAPLLLRGINTVAAGLHYLGTDRIADTFAERILAAALAIEDDAMASLPPAGTA